MKAIRVLPALIFALSCVGFAQVPQNNPLLNASQKIGEQGLTTESAEKVEGWAFKPSGSRILVAKYASAFGDDEAQRKTFAEAIVSVIESYEEAVKELKQSNDPATALAFSFSALYGIANGYSDDDDSMTRLAARFRKQLAGVKATDLQKQEFYEFALSSCCSTLILAAMVEEEKGDLSKIKTVAAAQIKALIGADLNQITVKGKEFTIKGSAAPVATTTGGYAPGFAFSTPAGFTLNAGWYAKTLTERRNISNELSNAFIRLLPAIPAKGNIGDALSSLWKTAMPQEMAGKAGGMIYRRYVGNKLIAQFISGSGREKGRRTDTLFTLMLVDCKSHWQPVVIAQNYEDQGDFIAGEDMSAGFSYPKTWSFAEEFLATFRCAGSEGQPLATKEALAGNYEYGSGGTQNWVNIYTGATSMTFSSYGGELNLNVNGTFTWRISTASGAVGATTFRGATGSGSWKIEGDILACKYEKYDQGDGYKVKEAKYRIAGITNFSDGVKVAVLVSELNRPVSPVSLSDSSYWHSTKKK
jgi:hypothetical protein